MPLRIRENVLAMAPYVPGKPIEEVQRELGLSHVVKLASNENPFGPSPKAVAAIAQAAAKAHLYPDGAAFTLKSAVSAKFGFPFSQIMVGNGSDELIHLLAHLVIESPADEIIMGDPAFVRYAAAADLAGCRLVKVPLDGDYRHDLQRVRAAVNEQTRIVYLDNPNNPTGTTFSHAALEEFLSAVPDGVLVVHDEAYYEFAQDLPDYPRTLELIARFPNLVVLRTMSKAYGIAGLRVGYGFAREPIVDAVNRAREPFNLNSLALVGGAAALEDDAYVLQTVENNATEMERMAVAFEALGFRPIRGSANFLLVDLHEPAQPWFESLLKRGVIVRSGHVLGVPNCLRVSIGKPEETDALLSALHAVASERKAVTA